MQRSIEWLVANTIDVQHRDVQVKQDLAAINSRRLIGFGLDHTGISFT